MLQLNNDESKIFITTAIHGRGICKCMCTLGYRGSSVPSTQSAGRFLVVGSEDISCRKKDFDFPFF